VSEIKTQDLAVAYGKRSIIEGLDVTIPSGKITTLIGPNGCGKSTLLKTMARILSPIHGQVHLDGKTIHKEPTKKVAQEIALLPQSPNIPESLTVKELVSYGRAPYQKGFGQLRANDWEKIHWALDQTHLLQDADRFVDSLSGGQRQRVWIAMALAQDTDVLLLDEPTTYLDMAHQLDVLHVLEKLNKEHGRTIVMVLHDINHASRFSDYMVAMKSGTIVAEGTSEEVMTTEVLRKVYEIEATIVSDPITNKPACLTYQKN
jgi:iron complex transport system ATP-binding protein